VTRRRAYLGLLVAAAMFGATMPIARLLMEQSAYPPSALASTYFLGAGLGLTAYALLRRPGAGASLTRADAPTFLLGVLLGGLLAPQLILAGVARASGVIGALGLNLEAPLTALIAVVLFGEQLGARVVVGGVAIASGSLLLAVAPAADGIDSSAGVALVSLGCLCYALDNNVTARIAGKDPVRIAQLRGLIAGAIGLGLSVVVHGGAALAPLVRVEGAIALVAGFAGLGVATVLFFRALHVLGAARVGIVFATSPFIGALVAIPLLDERPTPWTASAALLMAAGLVAISRDERRAVEQ
jgi:drug/metabolite transporter (DMT)-like permease